jgi:hypothetical protein
MRAGLFRPLKVSVLLGPIAASLVFNPTPAVTPQCDMTFSPGSLPKEPTYEAVSSITINND